MYCILFHVFTFAVIAIIQLFFFRISIYRSIPKILVFLYLSIFLTVPHLEINHHCLNVNNEWKRILIKWRVAYKNSVTAKTLNLCRTRKDLIKYIDQYHSKCHEHFNIQITAKKKLQYHSNILISGIYSTMYNKY